MRTYHIFLLLTLILSSSAFAELSIQNIEKMVRQIRDKRVSKTEKQNTSPISPFIVTRQESNSTVKRIIAVQESKNDFVLSAIMNSSAFIDGAWYKKGDKVGDLTIESIAGDHVVLKKEKHSITLFFRSPKKILKISEEKK